MADDEDWPLEISQIDTFNTFYYNHDQYQRYHIHLMGIVPTTNNLPVRLSKGIGQRKNRLGLNAKIDANPDPYCVVETVGDDTGSTSYFPIGVHKFPRLNDTSLPLWDSKTILLSKKDSVTGIKFTMKDENTKRKDEFLCDMMIPKEDFPEPATSLDDASTETWKEYRIPCQSKSDRIGEDNDKLEWLVYLKITNGSDRVVTKEAIYT